MRNALAGKPSLELRRRIEQILEKLESVSSESLLSAEQLQVLREVEALGMTRAPDAWPTLQAFAKALARLVADLDTAEYLMRQRATQKLSEFIRRAGPALRKALAGQHSPGFQSRIQQLLEQLECLPSELLPSAEQLQALRAVESLEMIETREARRMLETLATGAPEARLTQEAKASLERLAKRAAWK